ncbi:MAG: hypothetical protein N2442_13115 [Spirochaetes bacterium]|nr:hypothetical protein [Spirochaetota bacterium]
MSTVHQILQVMHHVLQDNLLLYDVYLHMSSHFGIRKILTSNLEKTKEIARVIEAIEADPTPLEERFKPPFPLDPSSFDLHLSFDGYISFCDSLRTILRRERLVLELLELLLNSANRELETIPLHSLVEQTRRHIQILQDRLDLESMLST